MFGNHCTICGIKMVRFENPDRLMCPRESRHMAFLGTRGGRKKGDASSAGNLGKHARKKNKGA